MFLGSIFNSALKSMEVNQLALSVASNNIANASNPDYTRQRLLTHPAGPDGGKWRIGSGVEVSGVQAMRDNLVEARLRRELSAKFGSDTLAGRLGNVEAQFNDSNGSGLLQSITDFFNSFQALSQDPASLPLREQVKTRASALIGVFHASDRDLASVRNAADKAVAADVGVVNRLTSQIADLNLAIKSAELTAPAQDLRDRRAAQVKELSQYVEVNELDDSGTYQLTTKDNQLLVFNEVSYKLSPADVTSEIGAGSLGAELEVRDTYVPKYTAALDQLAYEITQQVNSIHSAAYDLDGNTNVNFFDPQAAAPGAARLMGLSSDVSTDTRKIAASSLPVGSDNGAATALGNLLHSQVFSGGSLPEQYGSLVFAVGSDVANAESGSIEHQALLTQLENRRQSVSGVSIDEETVQILQFQRAYQASARLIQTVDELLQTTLSLGA